MATVYGTEACGPLFSSDPKLPTSRDTLDETSPLLVTSRARQSSHSEDGTLIDPLCPRSSTRIPGCYSSRPLSSFTLRRTRASSG